MPEANARVEIADRVQANSENSEATAAANALRDVADSRSNGNNGVNSNERNDAAGNSASQHLPNLEFDFSPGAGAEALAPGADAAAKQNAAGKEGNDVSHEHANGDVGSKENIKTDGAGNASSSSENSIKSAGAEGARAVPDTASKKGAEGQNVAPGGGGSSSNAQITSI